MNVVPVDPQTARAVLNAAGINTPIHLPYPPSANGMWRNTDGKTLLSKQYRAWKREAAIVIALQRPRKLTGAYRLTVVATRPDKRARDLDNILKPISDALKAAGLIRDDSDAQSILVSWSTAAPDRNAGVQIVLEDAP